MWYSFYQIEHRSWQLCRQNKRFLDISDLDDKEAAIVCDMVEILKQKK